MRSKWLRILGIFLLGFFIILSGIEFWISRNKEDIFRKVQEIVNDNLNGQINIEDVKFRPFEGKIGLNFTLYNVEITDSLIAAHHKPFLRSDRIQIAIDLKGIYKGKFVIKDLLFERGDLNLFVQKDGYTNLSIFRSEKQKKLKDNSEIKDGFVNQLGNIGFINFGIHFIDSTTHKSYGAKFHDTRIRITDTDSVLVGHLKGNAFFDGLVFKPEKGGFLVNQEINMNIVFGYDHKEKKLAVYPSYIVSNYRDRIDLKGGFDLAADSLPAFHMQFKAKNIAVKNALPLLTERIHKQIDSIGIQTHVDTEVKMAGYLSPNMPRVDVHFKTDTFQYVLPMGTFRHMIAEGVYTNQSDTTQVPSVINAGIKVPGIKGFYETIPVRLDLDVRNLRFPRAKIKATLKADSTNLGGLLDPARYDFPKGRLTVDLGFEGSLKNFYNAKSDSFDGKLGGVIKINRVALNDHAKNIHLSNIDGQIVFDERALVFEDLKLSDGRNQMFLKGKVVDMVPYLFDSSKPLRALVNVNIPNWKLNWLESLFEQRTTRQVVKKRNIRLIDLLDNVIDNIEVVAKLQSNQMQYSHFIGKNVRGEFVIKNNGFQLKNFSLHAFNGGTVKISGEIDKAATQKNPIMKLKGKFTNASVDQVFKSFSNFGQKTLTSDNIKGKINANFQFSSQVTNQVKFIPETMSGQLVFDLSNGYLINFEPLLKIKKLVFKNRSFEHVAFAPIKSTFILKGQEIEIMPMEIESNVVTLFMDGIYSFGNKTNINIGIPLRNLRKRDSTYVLNPNDEQNKNASKIYLRAVDQNGEVVIKLAFKKKEN
jgi:hypothetical protein